MELKSQRLIAASRERTWLALNDPEVLKACIAGCEALEAEGEQALVATVAVRIGPVSARFKGRIQLSDVHAPERYTLNFEGQGGAAGFGKGSAQVQLDIDEATGGTCLRYEARAQVGGRLAQVGSRLVDAAAAKLADDFFAAFEQLLSPASSPDSRAEAGGTSGDASAGAPDAHRAAPTLPVPWRAVAVAGAVLLACLVYLARA